MTGRVQSLRSSVPGNRPTGRQPGELYVNWPDGQLGVINASSAAQDLIAVRFFSALTSYNIGDYVIQGGKLYAAKAAVTPGAFNAAQWSATGGNIVVGDVAPTTPDPGTLWFDSVGGNLYVWYVDPNTSQWVIATNMGAALANYLPLGGGVLTGALTLPADPTVALGAATKQYSDLKLAKLGVTDGSDAPAGQIGEVISSVVLQPGVSLTNGVAANVTSISLTAGDWDVQGEAWVTLAPAITSILCWISSTSAAAGPQAAINASRSSLGGAAGFLAGTVALPLRPARVSLSAPATCYLGVTAAGGATNAAFGNIWARRVR